MHSTPYALQMQMNFPELEATNLTGICYIIVIQCFTQMAKSVAPVLLKCFR